ncbi:hypothetical protein HF086_004984 [Spodoptera exigua]|uniref:Signal recognition particle receptor subunit beta n=1 Tax=Spodoptera exigua TaxID=7107 RepID=A0A922M2M5_SPOEX|nr:hypothetical protein HF086_004984 [Spodoptera exigua]
MESEVIKEKIHTEPMLNDPRYITLLSVIVLLFTLVFWWFFSRRRQVRKSVLLMGLSDSGKTLLFVRLAYSQYRQTFTSMKENIEEYITSNDALKIVDLPGQERLRNKFFDQYKNSAKSIVYVVDSVTIQKEIRDVAENLVRVTKSSQLQSVDPSQGNNSTYLGKIGKDFEFSHLSNRVEIAESSANTGDDDTPADIKSLQDWISKL